MTNKTVPKGLDVADYMAAIEKPERRVDCEWLLETLTNLTGHMPKLWGGTLKSAIVGFGDYHYKYDSGREGDAIRIGFANRAQSLSIYIMPGYQDFGDELSRLGKHKMGKSCLYIKRLSDVDTDVLTEMLQKGFDIMAEKYPE
jgi:hypothetical protein